MSASAPAYEKIAYGVCGGNKPRLKLDKDKIYICTSLSRKELFHAFLCANGQCRGLYPNPKRFLGIGYGYVEDDTAKFYNPEL